MDKQVSETKNASTDVKLIQPTGAQSQACCAPSQQAVCCEPSQKASCCGTASSGSCGCK
jgi:hypothetical protein